MSEHTIIHCYDWPLESKTRMLRIAREFLDNGCRRFVFTCGNIQKALAHPEHLQFLKEEFVPRMGVELVAMHGPFGPLFDLNIPVPERRPGMIADHLRALDRALRAASLETDPFQAILNVIDGELHCPMLFGQKDLHIFAITDRYPEAEVYPGWDTVCRLRTIAQRSEKPLSGTAEPTRRRGRSSCIPPRRLHR